MVKVTGRPKTQ